MLDLRGLRKSLKGRLKRGDFRGAALYLAALQTRDPQPETAVQLAQMQIRCRTYMDALAQLRREHRQWPGNVALLRMLAETAMLAQNLDEAAQAWLDLIAAHPPDAPYPVLRALACLRATHQHDRAQDMLSVQGERLRKYMARAAVRMLRKGRWSDTDIPRGLYLVSGNNGTGKSTLGHFLHAMGYHIIDADTEIASFSTQNRFSDLRYDLLRATGASETDLRWSWPDIRVTHSFAAARKRKEPVFVIGGHGATVAPYIPRFRQVFHLTVPDDVIAARLAKRNSISHKVGSRGYLAALKRNARAQIPDYAATLIEADRPVWAVCADVLAAIKANAATVPAAGSPAPAKTSAGAPSLSHQAYG